MPRGASTSLGEGAEAAIHSELDRNEEHDKAGALPAGDLEPLAEGRASDRQALSFVVGKPPGRIEIEKVDLLQEPLAVAEPAERVETVRNQPVGHLPHLQPCVPRERSIDEPAPE